MNPLLLIVYIIVNVTDAKTNKYRLSCTMRCLKRKELRVKKKQRELT
jgi:hypothetical protein